MSGWAELLEAGIVVRPFDGAPPREFGNYSRFDTSWHVTVRDVARELRHLHAKQIVLELAVTEGDLRLDGMPRASARLSSQAVRLSFESKHGPLRYETGEYRTWQDNVRAIALSMHALRAVDRYGVSKRGEQYRGWRQLTVETGNPEDAVVTAEHAREVLARTIGVPINSIQGSEAEVKRAIRLSHPDRGGDPVRFRMVVKAREVLGFG